MFVVVEVCVVLCGGVMGGDACGLGVGIVGDFSELELGC